MSGLLGYLPYLGILACPLMMVFCVFGMRKMGGGATATIADPMQAMGVAVSSDQTVSARIGALQAQLTQLQREQASATDELVRSSTPASAAHVTGPR